MLDVWMAAKARGNPYIDRLVEHLRGEGANIEAEMEPQDVLFSGLAADGPPDVVHLHWLTVFFLRDRSPPWDWLEAAGGTGTFLGLLTAFRAAGTAIVWTAHNLGNHEQAMWVADRVCHRVVARTADAVIAHSPSARRRIAETYGLGDTAIHVVPHGNYIGSYPDEVDRERARAELRIPNRAKVLLFIGQIRRYKNVPRLIRTFRDVSDGDDQMLLVAGNPADEDLERRVRGAAGSDPSVDLELRFIDDSELQYFLNAADAAVLPYREILTSGAAVLALSFGTPVVAPRLGTLADVVGDDGGRLYAPGEADGLARALRWALEAPRAKLRRIGRHNRSRAEAWDWQRVASTTLDVYEQARD